ncbi:MAG TPA: chorismate-binding protein [Polyangiaceae bacterium]|nr:chorismate-binding protein [Polyangiaceae bacterium]
MVTRTFAADHITPVRAYASLRSHAPGRSSFLLEAEPGTQGERFSIVGYRVKTESLYPGGGNALDLLEQDLASDDVADTFPERLSQALVGYIAYDVTHAMLGIDPWPDETDVARLMRDATVAVFDHAKQTMTIAGRTKGAVERCAWEMTHGPDLPAMAVPDANARPEFLEPTISDTSYTLKAKRALSYIEGGEAKSVVLGRGFRSPLRGADPFDIYRALRVLSPARYHFFLEFGEMPMAEGIAIAGAADEVLVEGPSRIEPLREKFPASSVVGEPKKRAAEIIRELEVGSRRAWGGVVGYAVPGGSFELTVARVAVIARRGFLEVTGAAELAKGLAPEAGTEATWTDARAAFAAIRAAHDSAKMREAADEARRAKEEAAERARAEAEANAAVDGEQSATVGGEQSAAVAGEQSATVGGEQSAATDQGENSGAR